MDKKYLSLAYALWALSFVGICGVQRMYLGQPGLGVAMLFTFGFCGFCQVLDLLLLPDALNQVICRLGFFKDEVAEPVSPSLNSAPVPHSIAKPVPSAQVDELDQLLRQAEQSVSRTKCLDNYP